MVNRRFGTGAAAPIVPVYDPQTQGSLVNWYDASVLAYNNGDSVDTWTDLKLNNPNPMTSSSPGVQAVYSTPSQNGLGTVSFSGTKYYSVGGSNARAYPRTCATVFKINNATSQHTILGPNEYGGIQFRTSLTVGTPSIAIAGNAVVGTSSVDVNDGLFHTVIYMVDDSTWAIYVDGVAAGSGVNTLDFDNAPEFSIGAEVSPPIQLMNGFIAEIQLYSTILSASDITACSNFLKSKWATP